MLSLIGWTVAIIAAAAAFSALVMTLVVRYLPAWMGVELPRPKSALQLEATRKKNLDTTGRDSGIQRSVGSHSSPKPSDLRRFRRAPWTDR
ncbi:hypothetical protein PT015_01380 [Candidatus Mycobacterium wuenschmannii]|uniref:Uncharacterized protein n=1 Tax=Candidatus Mycobacterium wuenschmannii TaxID=3027808 RepID=A0ABY8VX40_9MYCO|nr:hypothetical protein [Candidatus Mycobacterium wuenschmannii]WIM88204.1 hypothetical protein PT015_01380 [Candidatus Mycobacterium wuenschmannii]